MSTRPHFNTLDGIRGLAALLVVIFHAEQFVGARLFPESYLAVDVFFLLSGAVVANAYEVRLKSGMSFGRFAWLRVARIYPLYLLGSVLGLLVIVIAKIRIDASLTTLTVGSLLLVPTMQSLILFPFDMPAWSLSVELWGNLGYALTLKWLNDRIAMALMALCAAGLGLVLWHSTRHNLDLGVMRILFYVGYLRFGYSFLAGVLLYRWFMKNKGPEGAQPSSMHAWLAAGCVTAVLMLSPPPSWTPFYDFFAVVVVFPVLIYWAMHFRATGVSATAFNVLGVLSYPVYMLHDPLMVMMKQASLTYTTQDIAAHAPYAGLLLLPLVICLAWLANRYYDEPVRAWLGKMAKRNTQSTPLRV